MSTEISIGTKEEMNRVCKAEIDAMIEAMDDSEGEDTVYESVLDVEFRSGWVSSRRDIEPKEYRILLSTGGPAARIVGEIEDGEVVTAELQYQDWFIPWIPYEADETEQKIILKFAQYFNFSE